jgi:colanic acid/amylovoran biosynthesis protein
MEIGERFNNQADVTLISEELSAVELENLIGKFDFLIGSRYHSLIHAYKNHVPVIAIGWAVKYEELLERFQQSEYFFDGREEISRSEFLNSITDMDKKLKANTEKVTSKTSDIQQNDLFSRIFTE